MKFIIALVFSFVCLFLFSQENTYTLSVKSGAGISHIIGNPKFKELYKPNTLSISNINGLAFTFQTESEFHVQTEILTNRRSYSRAVILTFEDSSSLFSKQKTFFDYVSVSLLLGFKTKGKSSFIFNLGPSFNYLVNNQTKFLIDTYSPKFSNNQIKGLPLKQKLELGAVIELGFQQKIYKQLELRAGVRNEISLVNKNISNNPHPPLQFNTTNVFLELVYVFKNIKKGEKKEKK